MISQKEITKLIKSDPCEACRLLKKSKSKSKSRFQQRKKLEPTPTRSSAIQYSAPYLTNPYTNITQPLQPRLQTSPLEQMQQFALMARATGLLPKEEVAPVVTPIVAPVVEKKEQVIRKRRTEPEANPVGGFEPSLPPPSLGDIYNQQDLKQDFKQDIGGGGEGRLGPISVIGEVLQFPNYTEEDAYVIRNIDTVRDVKARDRTPEEKQVLKRFTKLQKRNDFDDYVNSPQFAR